MKENLVINGGSVLKGSVVVDSAKNALLPILAGCILAEGEFEIGEYVDLCDIHAMREILDGLNFFSHLCGRKLYISTKHAQNCKISTELTQKVRASIFLLGPLLARFKEAVIAYPGGCKIGARPIDLHIKGFRDLGVKIVEKHGYIYAKADQMKAGKIMLDFPSVGATESLMMCACLLDGVTTIKNSAKEPEIVDLQNFLNKMGAKVSGAGSGTIKIVGVKKLHGCEYRVMPDRIVAGTYLLATAMCGGDVLVRGAILKDNEKLISFLKQTACQIDCKGDKIRLRASQRLSSIKKIETFPFPLFPTDLQAPMMALQAVSDGASLICENVFENRFSHAMELNKMGADIVVSGRNALVRGVEKLYGADVFAGDLRAGAALVLAGMKAEGYTTVHNAELIDRGYERIEEKYNALGADVKRIFVE